MPIFTSRFSSNRVAGGNLQRVHSQANQAIERIRAERTRPNTGQARQQQTERSQNTERSERTDRTRNDERTNLPARSQLAETLAERLRDRHTNASGRTDTTTTTTEPTTTPSQTTQTERPTQTQLTDQPAAQEPARPTRQPGVGTVRTRADDDVERPGRLSRRPANPAREQALDQFSRLRVAPRGRGRANGVAQSIVAQQTAATTAQADGDTQTVSGRVQTRPQNAVTGLNRQVDNRIRLLASNINTQRPDRQTQTADPAATAQRTPTQTLTGAVNTAPVTTAAPIVQTAQEPQPTAEDISRANTTTEIQENLQEDSREVARGLSRDAIRQSQTNTLRLAQNAEQASESRSNAVQRESQSEVRELQTEERELQRELLQTQQEIRSQRTRAQRASSTPNTASAAAAIGTGLNILAG